MNLLGEEPEVVAPSLNRNFQRSRHDNTGKKWYPFPTDLELILSF
jgi:hypothetical protein